jgi:hypothetical protein
MPQGNRYIRPARRHPARPEEKTIMIIPALSLLSVELWLTYLAAFLLALRLHRTLQFRDRLVTVLARRARQRRPDLGR